VYVKGAVQADRPAIRPRAIVRFLNMVVSILQKQLVALDDQRRPANIVSRHTWTDPFGSRGRNLDMSHSSPKAVCDPGVPSGKGMTLTRRGV
jgi:hypothetical protein